MYKKNFLPALGALLLAACGQNRPEGAAVIDEAVALTRNEHNDSATRELDVDGGATLVAFVDEQLTDVRIRLEAIDPGDAVKPVEVENNLNGAGIEIAVLEVPDDTRIAVKLIGPQNSKLAGSVRLRVQLFTAAAARNARFATALGAWKAWSAATNASFRADSIKSTALADMDRAIAALETPRGDAALAAEAHLIKADMLYFHAIDWRAARVEAQRAAKGFAALPVPDTLNGARARFKEALSLLEISSDRAAVNPTSEEAFAFARATFEELAAPSSVFGLVERAHVVHAVGSLNHRRSKMDEARKYFEQSLAMYREAGYAAGVVQMSANIGVLLGDTGRFEEAAQLYEQVLPDIEKIANPDERVSHLINASRPMALSGRTDQAVELLLKAIAQAQKFKMRTAEARALLTLGHVYQNRADMLQARAYFDESLKIARGEQSTMEYVWALAAAGNAARLDGDLKSALEMHEEATTRGSTPIGKVRTLHDLGADYVAMGDFPAATKAFRDSLAVSLGDPRHHAYTDVKRYLALVLVEHGDGSRATLKEADALLADALEVCLRVHDVSREMGARGVIAELRLAQGRPAQARSEFEHVFALARALREKSANSDARGSALPEERIAFRGYLDLLLRNVAARGPGLPRAATRAEESALRQLEIVRDAALDAERIVQLDAATNARVDELLEQMAGKSLRVSALLKSDLAGAAGTELAALQLEMSSLHAEIDQLRTAAAKKAAAETPTTDEARGWRTVMPGVVQLSYSLGNQHVYAWTRGESGMLVTVLAQAPEQLERELAELGKLDRQTQPEKVEEAIERISTVLLPGGVLPAKSTAVEILAEGRIAGIPFPGLRSPTDPTKRLLETHTVTMISSLLANDVPRRPTQARPYRLVALASGHGTLRQAALSDLVPRLTAATKEVRVVASLFEARDPAARVKLLLGAEGSAKALRGIWGSGVDVVHFATHALADLRQPLASLLVLPATNAKGEATYLTAGQVREWRGDADLVFLSACESAIGPPRFAAGMPGLQSAFLRAGARGVIATLWPIEDLLAQEFSADFYERFTRGAPAAVALSETQRAWLLAKPGTNEAVQMRRRLTALAHAYYMR